MNLETPLWKSRALFWVASAVLALSLFFSLYDFGWRPHQSLTGALFYAALTPFFLLIGTAVQWAIGRLFRVPVEWNFLLRVQVWLTLLTTPLYAFNLVSERVFAWQENGRALATWMAGVWIVLWIIQVVRRYQSKPRVSTPQLRAFCASIALLSAVSAIATQRGPQLQVMGVQPWQWQTHGRVRLAYTEQVSSAETAREDARRADEMLRRVERALGAPSSARQVNVFLFPDQTSLREFAQDDWLVGVAGEGGVLIVDDEWEWMRGTLVHELGHFVIAREFGPDVRALADEGTAVWLEQKLAASDEALAPNRHLDVDTANLAYNDHFYDEDDEQISLNYEQAGWLAKSTIAKHGLPKWRRFLQNSQSGYFANLFELPSDASEQVKEQYQQIFGEPLP